MTDKTTEAVATAYCGLIGVDPSKIIDTQLIPGTDNVLDVHRQWQLYAPEARTLIDAHLKALEADGLVLVPAEPTDAMVESGFNRMDYDEGFSIEAENNNRIIARSVYSAMLRAHSEGTGK